jgi:hypothetical protein
VDLVMIDKKRVCIMGLLFCFCNLDVGKLEALWGINTKVKRHVLFCHPIGCFGYFVMKLAFLVEVFLEAKKSEKKTTNTSGPSSLTQENWTFVLCYCFLGRSFETKEEKTRPIDKNACKTQS